MSKAEATAKFANTNSEALMLINRVINELSTSLETIELMRVDKRYPLESKVLVGTKDANGQFVAEYEAWGVDLSNNGISFLTIRPIVAQLNLKNLPRGQKLSLLLERFGCLPAMVRSWSRKHVPAYS